ncbi:MAG: hypothetical protein V1647_01325, partial [Pseudomonadota bacterium]
MKTAFLALFFMFSTVIFAEICDPNDENSFAGFDNFIADNAKTCADKIVEKRNDGDRYSAKALQELLYIIEGIKEWPLERKQDLCAT